jgi:hypothetical protein
MALPDPGIPLPVDAAPAAPVAPRAQPSTYRELVSYEANGPPPDQMANFLQRYCFDGGTGAVPTPATLRDQTINLSDTRQPLVS